MTNPIDPDSVNEDLREQLIRDIYSILTNYRDESFKMASAGIHPTAMYTKEVMRYIDAYIAELKALEAGEIK